VKLKQIKKTEQEIEPAAAKESQKNEKRGIFHSIGNYGGGFGSFGGGHSGGGGGGDFGGSYGGGDFGGHSHHEHIKTITIEKKVPVPYTVHKHVPYTVEKKVPYEVKVPIPQPYVVEKKSTIHS